MSKEKKYHPNIRGIHRISETNEATLAFDVDLGEHPEPMEKLVAMGRRSNNTCLEVCKVFYIFQIMLPGPMTGHKVFVCILSPEPGCVASSPPLGFRTGDTKPSRWRRRFQ